MVCEVFFEIHGSEQEQESVSLKIAQFLDRLQNSGEICELSGTFETKTIEEVLK